MNTFSTVSSDDVLASYQQQLSDAHHRIAILEARLTAALKYINEPNQGSGESAHLENDK